MNSPAGRPPRGHGETVVKRVSRRHHDEGHGGSWKVAFADFCLALMCLFLVLWVLGAREEQNARHMLGQSTIFEGGSGLLDGDGDHIERFATVDARVSEPTPQTEGRADTPKTYESDDELKTLAAWLEKLASESNLQTNLQTVITPSGLRVMLHDTDNRGIFELGSAVPDIPFYELLKRMGGLFSKIGNPILVIGHTDATPFRMQGHSMRSNWHLSNERAMAAKQSLHMGGLSTDSVLQVVGMADRAPLDTDNPRAAMNRRIEFLILTKRRAVAIEQMFGAPSQVVPLIDGVNAVAADSAEGRALQAEAEAS